MRRTLLACLSLLITGTIFAQNNPVPFLVQPLSPTSVAPGHPAFTLTVTGTGFASGAVVKWNGSPRSTTFISQGELEATINASDVARANTASVTVANPGPGGGNSNVIFFPVLGPSPSLAFARRDTPITEVAGDTLAGVVTADFNNDGNLDIAVGWSVGSGGMIETYLNNGDGTFQPPILTQFTVTVSSLLVGDFNGDGNADIAFAYPYNCGGCGGAATPYLYILLGTGDGHFQMAANAGVVVGWPEAAADFNGDGKLDLLTTSTDYDGFDWYTAVNLGNGDGTFGNPISFPFPASMYSLPTVGDFNEDGKLDVALPDYVDNHGSVDVSLGNGDGTFKTKAVRAASSGSSAAAGDVNRDGNLDIVTSGIETLLGNGDGMFTQVIGPNGCCGVPQMQLVDFNNDNKLDAVFESLSFYISLGNGEGDFRSLRSWGGEAGGVAAYAIGDFYDEGRLGIAGVQNDFLTGLPVLSIYQQTALSIPVTTLNFGFVPVGSSSVPQTVTLTNIGKDSVNVSGVHAISNVTSYSEQSACVAPLATGDSCTIAVTFTPQQTGTLQVRIAVRYTGTTGSPQYIEVTGLGGSEP